MDIPFTFPWVFSVALQFLCGLKNEVAAKQTAASKPIAQLVTQNYERCFIQQQFAGLRF